jgi:alkylation response protein AidB-like acyl-CoA dehydrogenase
MDFTLSSDEEALRDGVRDFCARRYGEEALRAQTPADRALWSDLGGLGLFALRLPESDGGAGLGQVEAVLAFAELGAALVPGPLVAAHLAAGLVDGAESGETVVGWLDATTHPYVIEHVGLLDSVLVADTESVATAAVTDLPTETVELPLDPLTPVARLTSTLPAGAALDADVAALRRDGALLTAAYQVGIAATMTTRSVAYAKEREQFGRPIGSFQAVKHLCADMLVRAELARAAVHAAAVTVGDPSVGDPDRAVAGAKVLADEAALQNTRTAIQVHGGMGFTWEVPLHLFLKRATLLATTFGTADEHALALAVTA